MPRFHRAYFYPSQKIQTYLQCFDKLNSLVPALQDLVAFGTDGEHNLSEALSTCFTKAFHLRCFRTRRNFKPKHTCSHAVAVTEKDGALEEFVKWYKGQNIKGGLSSVAAINVNTRAPGRKQGAKCQRNTTGISISLA